LLSGSSAQHLRYIFPANLKRIHKSKWQAT
jgi:hypothetical protein